MSRSISTAEDAEETNEITRKVIGAAMKVHSALGPGLLESAYEACMAWEVTQGGLRFEQQEPLPLVYREVWLDCGYRLYLLTAQLLSYLRLSGRKVGLLINFNTRSLRYGIRRVVNELPESSASSASAAVKS